MVVFFWVAVARAVIFPGYLLADNSHFAAHKSSQGSDGLEIGNVKLVVTNLDPEFFFNPDHQFEKTVQAAQQAIVARGWKLGRS